MYDVVIVGAGISGLTAAYRVLAQAPQYSVLLLESEAKAGGMIQSVKTDGFLVEAGPNMFQHTDNHIFSLCDSLRIKPIPANPCAKNRFILHQESLHPVPATPWALICSGLLSPMAKLRLLLEPFQPSSNNPGDETVSQFTRRRFGEEVLDNLLGPFLSGIYASDPEILSVQSMLPSWVQHEKDFGSILKGVLQVKKQEATCFDAGLAPAQFYSFQDGIETLPKALLQALPQQSVRLKTAVQGITTTDEHYILALSTGEMIKTRALVLATPAGGTAKLVELLHQGLAQRLQSVSYVPLTVAHVGFHQSTIRRALDGFGFLVSKSVRQSLLACIWMSSLFPCRSPENHVLLSCYLKSKKDTENGAIAESEHLHSATEYIAKALNSAGAKPIFHTMYHYSNAMPQYSIDHGHQVTLLQPNLRQLPGLFLVGSYLQGLSLDSCIREANNAGDEVVRYIRHVRSAVI